MKAFKARSHPLGGGAGWCRMAKVRIENLDRRIGKAVTFIDVAIAHLKSYLFAKPDPSIESAITWLEDAKSELQYVLDDTAKNVVIFVDLEVAKNIARKARVENAIEVLVDKCIDEYMSSENG
jgi:hypothetical protein